MVLTGQTLLNRQFREMSKFLILACAAFAANGFTSHAYAEDWPAWRGALGDGTVSDPDAPIGWKLPKNQVWKTPIPGKGHASPIIIGDRIYVVAVIEETETRELLCLERKSGKELWRKVVLKSPLERVHRLNSRASSTPSCDGERIYLSFLDQNRMFVAAYLFSG